MKRSVEMIRADDDRDVLELDWQSAGTLKGGGRIKRTHDSLNYLTGICSTVALWAAWQKFSRGKRSRADVGAYRQNLLTNLRELQRELAGGAYHHGLYVPFKICDPKPRQIHKASVRDRLVHQALVSAIEPFFERKFIFDSYSCRKNKGTHAGARRLRAFLRQVSANNTYRVYALKCDIRQFFASVDHEILLRCLERHMPDEAICELLRTVLLSHGAENGRGLPLGNITSQLFANVYLHELDWFIKQQLGVKHYVRYCDDFVIVSREPDYLRSLLVPIRAYVRTVLRLDLHPHKVSIRSWDQGVDFLGYVTKPHALVLRTKTRRRMLARVNSENISSYLSLCSHADTYRLQQVINTKTWLLER